MKLDLSGVTLPASVAYEIKGKRGGSSAVVFQYSGGEVLTASGRILDPANWESVKIRHEIKYPIAAPPWFGKDDAELTEHFEERSKDGIGLGKFVPDVHIPVSESQDEAGAKAALKPRESVSPKSVTQIMPEDDCSDEEAFGEAE